MFTIVITGLKELEAGAVEAGAAIEPLMKAGLFAAAVQAQAAIREAAPHRTGNLQRSVLAEATSNQAMVVADAPYGIYVEEGTRPHEIRPKHKRALFWAGASNPYKVIHHPGTKANPFFEHGIEVAMPLIIEEINKLGTTLLEIVARGK